MRANTFHSWSYGSSPRARGTPSNRRQQRHSRRIIPACAGNTHESTISPVTGSDHPRVRGEHASARAMSVDRFGSSPRARGTRVQAPARRRHPRIIPACAGNTPRTAGQGGRSPDHPRVRGEHSRLAGQTVAVPGSSPRARGTPVDLEIDLPLHRIIPACAGNTSRAAAGLGLVPDHPRVRGEHMSRQIGVSTEGGSSPRARGTPHLLAPGVA